MSEDTVDRRQSRLGSLKSILSRSSKPSSSTPVSNKSPHPEPAPATRRPYPRVQSPSTNLAMPDEAPPAYTPNPEPRQGNFGSVPFNNLQAAPISSSTASPSTPTSPQQTSPTVEQTAMTDDRFVFLGTFDTLFLIDDSGSMAGRSWRETSQALEFIVPVCTKWDRDGVDIKFLNSPDRPFFSNVTEPSTVHEIFSTVRPSGGTPTGQRLNQIWKEYQAMLEADRVNTKPLNIILITDGEPSDDIESVIIRIAKKLDQMDAEPWQFGIQMVQVGDEPGAAAHLAGLDDELSRMGGGCRDIVDTVPFIKGPHGRGTGLSGEGILKIVLGAVNKRLDRRRNSDEVMRQ